MRSLTTFSRSSVAIDWVPRPVLTCLCVLQELDALLSKHVMALHSESGDNRAYDQHGRGAGAGAGAGAGGDGQQDLGAALNTSVLMGDTATLRYKFTRTIVCQIFRKIILCSYFYLCRIK